MPPVFLGRKIDDPVRAGERTVFCDEHFSHAHLALFTRRLVSGGVGGKRLAEHQGDTRELELGTEQFDVVC
jgi:hypothetical protein